MRNDSNGILKTFLRDHEVMQVFKPTVSISMNVEYNKTLINFHYQKDAYIEEEEEERNLIIFGTVIDLDKYLDMSNGALGMFYAKIFNEVLKQFKLNDVGEE